MTGFKGTRNVNGRPKGAVNKTTAQTKNALQKIVSNELDKFDEMLEALDPKDRLEILIKILPFVLPKQTQIEIEANEINPFRPITINLLSEPLQIETNENTD